MNGSNFRVLTSSISGWSRVLASATVMMFVLAIGAGQAIAIQPEEISECDSVFREIESIYAALLHSESQDASDLNALQFQGSECARMCRDVLNNPEVFRIRPPWGICQSHQSRNALRPIWNAI